MHPNIYFQSSKECKNKHIDYKIHKDMTPNPGCPFVYFIRIEWSTFSVKLIKHSAAEYVFKLGIQNQIAKWLTFTLWKIQGDINKSWKLEFNSLMSLSLLYPITGDRISSTLHLWMMIVMNFIKVFDLDSR